MSDIEHDLMTALNWAGIDAAAGTADFELAHELAKAPSLAGYSKPRTVTTVEELDALALRTVVRDGDEEAWELTDNGWRYWMYDESFTSRSLALPATVLYEPTA